jgi:uncharacterized protein
MPCVHGGPDPNGRVRSLAAVLVPVLAVWNNAVVPRLSGRAYTVLNASAAGVLVVAARGAGLSPDELGLDPRRLGRGARSCLALAAPLTVAYGTALAVPATRSLLRDARVGGLSPGRIAGEALVRIPFGTVLWEEVAFRGVLEAALRRLLPPRATTAASAVLFGIWHVHPTLAGARANDLVPAAGRATAAVLVGTAGTAAAGVLFSGLRQHSGSLLAPAVVHLTANSGGLISAAAAHRLPVGGVRRGR